MNIELRRTGRLIVSDTVVASYTDYDVCELDLLDGVPLAVPSAPAAGSSAAQGTGY